MKWDVVTRQQTSILFLALFVFCVAICGLYWARGLALTDDGFPLDDAWIYAQFARTSAAGHFGEFNSGEVVTGITGPLWALLLTPLHALAGENVGLYVVLVKVLGILLLYGSAISIFYLGAYLFRDPRAGVAAAFFLLLMPKIVWGTLSGMEAPLLVFLLLTSLNLMARHRDSVWKRNLLTPLVIGLAGHTRPEANVLFAIFVAYQWLVWWPARGERPLQTVIRDNVVQTLVWLVVLSPNVLFSYSVTGQPIANTFYAKTRGLDLAASLRFLAMGSSMVWFDPPATATLADMLTWPPRSADMALRLGYTGARGALVMILFVWGIRRAPDRRVALPALAWLIGDFLLYTILFTRSNRHYFVPMLPPIALLCGGGLVGMAEWLRGARRLWPALTLIFLFLSVGTIDWAVEYAWNVKNINEQQVAIGRWVDETLPADVVLAINDVGAIKYFSQRQIIDVTGLLTPELIPYIRSGRKLEYLSEAAPDYLIVYDTWFIEASKWEGFEWVRDFQLDRNTIAGGDTVRVYRVVSFPPSTLDLAN
jgi:arabinofuranosyltransferase